MANNDDSNKKSNIIRIGLPAAIFATTGRPEIIERKKVQANRMIKSVTKSLKLFLFNLKVQKPDYIVNFVEK